MNTQEQIAEVRAAMRQTKDRRLYERYQAVYLHLEGYKETEIGTIIDRHPKTVHLYLVAYRNGGLEGLAPGQHPGRPRRLSKEQEKELAETVISKLPSEVGFPGVSNWTLALVVEYTEQNWGIHYSLKGMSLLLKRQGLSYTRPTYTLAKADPERQRTFREETFPRLKKNF